MGKVLFLVMLVVSCSRVETLCQPSTSEFESMMPTAFEILHDDGSSVKLQARLADTPQLRAAGYQHLCPDAIAATAILFAYDSPVRNAFHMNNVTANLDIVFFDSQGLFVDQLKMKSPRPHQESRPYRSRLAFKWALEMPENSIENYRLGSGDRLKILMTQE